MGMEIVTESGKKAVLEREKETMAKEKAKAKAVMNLKTSTATSVGKDAPSSAAMARLGTWVGGWGMGTGKGAGTAASPSSDASTGIGGATVPVSILKEPTTGNPSVYAGILREITATYTTPGCTHKFTGVVKKTRTTFTATAGPPGFATTAATATIRPPPSPTPYVPESSPAYSNGGNNATATTKTKVSAKSATSSTRFPALYRRMESLPIGAFTMTMNLAIENRRDYEMEEERVKRLDIARR